MEDIFVKEAPTTPEIKLKFADNTLEVKGVSIPEDTEEFYNPILEAIEEYLITQKPQKVSMIFKLIYVNTSTSAILGKMIKLLEPKEGESRQIAVKWYYEVEDEDMKDLGEDFNSFSSLQFELIPCDEIA